MKKGLIFLLSIVSFLGINTVSADTTTIIFNYYDYFEEHIEAYNTYKENIDYMINFWEENCSLEYPYYFISLSLNQLNYSGGSPDFILYASDNNNVVYSSSGEAFILSGNTKSCIGYDSNLDSYDYSSYSPYLLKPNVDDTDSFNYQRALISNGLIYKGMLDQDTQSIVEKNFLINSYSNESLNLSIPEIELKTDSTFPTIISLYDDSYFSSNNYTEINLNDYSYVILTLKDYSPRDTFTSTMYVKGQLCATTVYNYGLEEKKDYVSGYQTPPCSYYYNDFTRFSSYIKSEDIDNHAIYYLTGYDSSKSNIVKVDTSVYDITYITSDNENEPYVSIEGKTYPALSYDSLTDSATLTEQNGISDTWTCAKYDTNCVLNSTGIDINNLFSNPLETLKTIWNVITSIFELITEFISLLPPIMQSFLYLAFGVGIAIGIIKLIL